VAYYALTGKPLFDGRQPIQVILAHAQLAPPPPSELREDIPADLELVVLRCLAKDPEDRYQDVASLAAALDECEAAGRWTAESAKQWWQANGHALRQEAKPVVV